MICHFKNLQIFENSSKNIRETAPGISPKKLQISPQTDLQPPKKLTPKKITGFGEPERQNTHVVKIIRNLVEDKKNSETLEAAQLQVSEISQVAENAQGAAVRQTAENKQSTSAITDQTVIAVKPTDSTPFASMSVASKAIPAPFAGKSVLLFALGLLFYTFFVRMVFGKKTKKQLE